MTPSELTIYLHSTGNTQSVQPTASSLHLSNELESSHQIAATDEQSNIDYTTSLLADQLHSNAPTYGNIDNPITAGILSSGDETRLTGSHYKQLTKSQFLSSVHYVKISTFSDHIDSNFICMSSDKVLISMKESPQWTTQNILYTPKASIIPESDITVDKTSQDDNLQELRSTTTKVISNVNIDLSSMLQNEEQEESASTLQSAIDNFVVSSPVNNIESNSIDIISDKISIYSDGLSQTNTHNIMYTPEASIQTESNIIADITSQDENLQETRSTTLISDVNIELSSTIGKEEEKESTNIDNIISATDIQEPSKDQSILHTLQSTIDNFEVSSPVNNIESSSIDIISDKVSIYSDGLSQTNTQNIMYTPEASIQTESNIIADITSQDENIQETQSAVLISDVDIELSSTIGNEEEDKQSTNIDNIISATDIQEPSKDQSILHTLQSTTDNFEVSSPVNNIGSNSVDVISDKISIYSDGLSQTTTQNIMYTPEASIQTESDIIADITSQDENLQETRSTTLISDVDIELSSTIGNEEEDKESTNIDNIISATGIQESSKDQSILHTLQSTIDNFEVSSPVNNIESNSIDIISDKISIYSDGLSQTNTHNIMYTPEASIQTESDIIADITSQDENLQETRSTTLISDVDIELSSTIGKEEEKESTNINNIISATDKVSIYSDGLSQTNTQNIMYTPEASIQTESDIIADITSQDENLQETRSVVLISDVDIKLSSTIGNEEEDKESTNIDNIISATATVVDI
ncbi:uncharacterized protein TRIADDRAFT_53734 [Trichoplax adhaerens]|uniref:Uncharacterized protein n=1 Tax=Trichoplax adhaerens TaxID=10228 RepID=B3RQ08_TRIAD|nr:hypothetical protein TRIADDRAFT_53734 [Trichoplax adhaerens]EDV27737.1 hypothetical protein TRIADDRAFT_53734 [Trichoplax adhaerens]|eukprot:XP_002109571.1 hypothetical protein TRIADDRAFT_53734 [Trichoplax adhaerens]